MSAALYDAPVTRSHGRLLWAAGALGFAIGGFFDGILLHQVLQWHHLLSGVQSPGLADLRVQVLADGLFHLLMYVIGAVGMVMLYRARRHLGSPEAGRSVVSAGLIGFGVWHIIDALASHWLTGIHRIKMDSDVPLVWDLVWLVAFGIVPFVIGWTMRRSGAAGGGRGHVAASILVLVVLSAAPVAALPPRDITGAVVLFRPDLTQAEMMSAVRSVGGRLVWTDASGDLWALDFDDPGAARELYGRGALLVSTSLFAGCLSWLQAD